MRSIIFTGGFGKGQKLSDSRIAQDYAINKGVPQSAISIEEALKITKQNLEQAKKIMDAAGVKTALLVSDPLHMKRAMKLATNCGIDCKSSPTQTSMYKSAKPKAKQLLYETFYISLREPISLFSKG